MEHEAINQHDPDPRSVSQWGPWVTYNSHDTGIQNMIIVPPAPLLGLEPEAVQVWERSNIR